MFLFCCKGILSRRTPPGRKPSLWEFTFTQTNPSLHLGDVGFSRGSYPQFFCHIRRREAPVGPSAPQAQGFWPSTSKMPLSWKASSTTSWQHNSDHDSVRAEPVFSAKERSAAPCHSPVLTNAVGTFPNPPTELKLL